MRFSYPLSWPICAGVLSTKLYAHHLNVTAISATDGRSTVECWSLSNPPSEFAGAVNYGIGNFSAAFIGVIPPQTHIGQAWAKSPQYSLVLSGVVHIQLPDSSIEAWIHGGKLGILIAADTKNISKTGHITTFPGEDDTVIAQFPFAEGVLPKHTLLYSGPCKLDEFVNIELEQD